MEIISVTQIENQTSFGLGFMDNRHRDLKKTTGETAGFLKNHSPSPDLRVNTILKKTSQGAFGSYVDIKRPSKAALQNNPISTSGLSSGTPNLVIVQQLEALTSAISLQTVSSLKQQHSIQKLHQCTKKHFAIEIEKVHKQVSSTILWNSLLKIIFLTAIVILLMYHIFHQSH